MRRSRLPPNSRSCSRRSPANDRPSSTEISFPLRSLSTTPHKLTGHSSIPTRYYTVRTNPTSRFLPKIYLYFNYSLYFQYIQQNLLLYSTKLALIYLLSSKSAIMLLLLCIDSWSFSNISSGILFLRFSRTGSFLNATIFRSVIVAPTINHISVEKYNTHERVRYRH